MKYIICKLLLLSFVSMGVRSQVITNPDLINQIELDKLKNLTLFNFDKKRPVCIVLIHGITNSVATSQRLINDGKGPNRPVNTLRYARHYWSYEFVQGLFNLQQDKIYTFTNTELSGELNASPATWETKHTNNSLATDHILTGCGKPNPYNEGPKGCAGFLTVMMTYRDGSLSLKKQAAATAAQIRSLYDQVFGTWPADKRPQLILMCHSGGGIVARTICTIPDQLGGGISSLGNSPVPIESFSAAEKSNLEFVRNRTMYITTLATPHEGAPIAKVADQVGQHIAQIPVIGQTIDDQDPHIPVMKELTPNIMFDYNKGPLHPSKCKRADGSLVPIYCLGGRAAAGPFFFNDPNKYDANLETPDGGITFTKSQLDFEQTISGRSNRREFESYGLLKADYLTTLIYGITSTTMIVPELLTKGIAGKSTGFDLRLLITPQGSPELDIVKIRNNGLLGCLDPPVFNILEFAVGPKMFYLRNNWADIKETILGISKCTGRYSNNGASTSGDGLIDCDGFVPIISAMAVNLGTGTKNYFSNSSGGNFYRFYRSAADYDHHGSIMNRIEVSSFIRQNITNLSAATNLFNGGIVDAAAGPYVNSTATKSVWTK